MATKVERKGSEFQEHCDESEIKSFCDHLFGSQGEGYVEVRAIRAEDSANCFMDVEELAGLDFEPLIEWIHGLTGNHHVYVGMGVRETGNDGSKSNIRSIPTLWCDLDASDPDEMNEARERLDECILTPTLIVNSGYGYHGYWLLNESEPVHRQQDLIRVESILKELAASLDGDSGCTDASRVMRLPGTPNIKQGFTTQKTSDDPSEWKRCRIEQTNLNHRYELSEFEDALKIETSPVERDATDVIESNSLGIEPKDWPDFDEKDLKKVVWPEVIRRAKTLPYKNQDVTADRSANDYWVACRLFEAGLEPQDVYEAFVFFAQEDWDAGEKYAEKKARNGRNTADEYLIAHTLPNAHDEVAKLRDEALSDLIEELPAWRKRIRTLEGKVERETITFIDDLSDEELVALAELELIDNKRAESLVANLFELDSDKKLNQADRNSAGFKRFLKTLRKGRRQIWKRPIEDDWKYLLNQPSVIKKILSTIEVDKNLGEGFECPIDGHGGSVKLWKASRIQAEDHKPFFSLDHEECEGPDRLYIPDLYASVLNGEVIPLKSSLRRIWTYRAVHDAPVGGFWDLPEPPKEPEYERLENAEAPDAAEDIYQDFVTLLQLKRFGNWKGEASAYSYSFIKRWCSVFNEDSTNTAIRNALPWLRDHDFLHVHDLESNEYARDKGQYLERLKHDEETNRKPTYIYAMGSGSDCECGGGIEEAIS